MNAKYKIALIEPSVLLVAGLKALLEDSGIYEVAFVFNTIQGYELRAPHIQPNLLIVSPSLFDYASRFNIRNTISLPEGVPLVAMVSAFHEEKILKQFDCVLDIADNTQSISAKLGAALKEGADAPEQNDNYNLSDRELDILVAVAKGLTNKEIADIHDISVNTVITHRKNITRKTGIKSVSGLTVYALLNNLIDQSDVE